MFINTKNKCLYMNHVNIGYQQVNNQAELEATHSQNAIRKRKQNTLYREFEDKLRLTSTKHKAVAAAGGKQGHNGTGSSRRRSVNLPTNLRVNIETNDRRDLELLDNARDYLRELIESRKRSRVPPAPCSTPAPSRPYTPIHTPHHSRVGSALGPHDRLSRDNPARQTQRAKTARASAEPGVNDSAMALEKQPPRPQSATSTSEILRKYGIEDKGPAVGRKLPKTPTSTPRPASPRPDASEATWDQNASAPAESRRSHGGERKPGRRKLPQTPSQGSVIAAPHREASGETVSRTDPTCNREEERSRDEALHILKGYRRSSVNSSRQPSYSPPDSGYPTGETYSDDESIDIEMAEDGDPETQVEREEEGSRTLNPAEKAFFQRHANAAGASYPLTAPPARSRAELRGSHVKHVARPRSQSRPALSGQDPPRRSRTPTLTRSRSFLSTAPRQPPAYQPEPEVERPSWPSASDIMRLRAGGFAYKAKNQDEDFDYPPHDYGQEESDDGAAGDECDGKGDEASQGSADWGQRVERPKTPGGTRMDPIIVPSHTTDDCPLCAVYYYNGDEDAKQFHFLHKTHEQQAHHSHQQSALAPALPSKQTSQVVHKGTAREAHKPTTRESANPGICSWTDIDKIKASQKLGNPASSSGAKKMPRPSSSAGLMTHEMYNPNSFPYKIAYMKIQESG